MNSGTGERGLILHFPAAYTSKVTELGKLHYLIMLAKNGTVAHAIWTVFLEYLNGVAIWCFW